MASIRSKAGTPVPGSGKKADARGNLSPDALAALNPELPADLKQAINTGRPDRLADVLENIRMDDPALAGALTKLVDRFEYEKILNLIHDGEKCR